MNKFSVCVPTCSAADPCAISGFYIPKGSAHAQQIRFNCIACALSNTAAFRKRLQVKSGSPLSLRSQGAERRQQLGWLSTGHEPDEGVWPGLCSLEDAGWASLLGDI